MTARLHAATPAQLTTFGGVEMSQDRYDRISKAHDDLAAAIARAGAGPRDAALAVSARISREHGPRTWSAVDLRAEHDACDAARRAHPDYAEWIRLSEESHARIARNRALGRPLLAYTDRDWEAQ